MSLAQWSSGSAEGGSEVQKVIDEGALEVGLSTKRHLVSMCYRHGN